MAGGDAAAETAAPEGPAPDGRAPDGPPADGLTSADEDRAADLAVVERQLGRRPRAVLRVAHRCACGLPDVVETAPRLEDGTPFPTLYYLTCPRASSAVARLESSGLMREMTARLGTEPELAAAYRSAHEDYLARRDSLGGPLPGDPGAGGMPDRVKCLHVLVAHSLASGPGVNPFGDEAIAAAGDWAARGRCVPDEPPGDLPRDPRGARA
ncbi:DUF501 domain-containing protein [Pseudofrankia inefficax]|uniref:Ppx/GppA phosphatase n=1 Tax=Pseudofrankia inefficax (strain DSM 45817 / CECT 9037 / DDB 130130 / EuI1c) TaxID=298654 RepID=E3JCN6_PSEI1|nr:DUF501 domain-containing protein [Pseudofrankia inefficax]ADP78732.1 protein of unknown function DUF501 [Pseudofrankia inefficax]